MKLSKALGVVCVAILSVSAWCATAPTVTIAVDATTAPRKIFHASLKIPATPGDLTLYYPKWIPGEHAPDGPVIDLAGLKFSAAGKTLKWRRDRSKTDSPSTSKSPPAQRKSPPNSTSSPPPPSKADSPPDLPPPTSSPSSAGTRFCSIPRATSPTTSTIPPASNFPTDGSSARRFPSPARAETKSNSPPSLSPRWSIHLSSPENS